jgi:hypothetical protein
MFTMEHTQSKPLLSKAHLTNLNLNIFKMIEAMRLKIIARGPLEYHDPRTKFHENFPSGSNLRDLFAPTSEV